MRARNGFREIESPHQGARAFAKGSLRVLLAKELDRWHLSISHPGRYPRWDEIVHARYALVPDSIYMAQILPPSKQYANVHPNTFHLWEIRDALDMRVLGHRERLYRNGF